MASVPIQTARIWINAFIPKSLSWDPAPGKVLKAVPEGDYAGWSFVKGPDLTSFSGVVGAVLSGGKNATLIGSNRGFSSAMVADAQAKFFKMHVDADIGFKAPAAGAYGLHPLPAQFTKGPNCVGGVAVKIDPQTWKQLEVRTAHSSGLSLGLRAPLSKEAPQLANSLLSAAGSDWSAKYREPQVCVLDVDMKCGLPFLGDSAETLGPMWIKGRVWIDPKKRWVLHNLCVAPFPNYEAYLQVDGGTIVTLTNDEVPRGNSPQKLAFGSAPTRQAEGWGVEKGL